MCCTVHRASRPTGSAVPHVAVRDSGGPAAGGRRRLLLTCGRAGRTRVPNAPPARPACPPQREPGQCGLCLEVGNGRTRVANCATQCLGGSVKGERSLLRRSHLTPPRLTSPHLTSPHLTSPHLTSPHLTSPHLTSPHLTSPHLTSPHLNSPLVTWH